MKFPQQTLPLMFASFAAVWNYIIAASGDYGFISAGDSLYNISMDTGVIQKLPISGLQFPAGIDCDPVEGKIYWAEYWGNKIGRCDLDGGNSEPNLIPDAGQPYGLVLDISNRWIYWSAEGQFTNSAISRANMDGSSRTVIVNIAPASPKHIALDTVQNKIYWSDIVPPASIRRANVDGSGVETLLSSDLMNVIGVALDIQAGLVFWCDWGTDIIGSLNLATNQRSTVYQSSSDISPYALALYEQDIYWVDGTLPELKKLARDGSGQAPEVFGSGANQYTGANGLRIKSDVCSKLGEICKNDGTCVNQPSGSDIFTCQCTINYKGRLCETLEEIRRCETPDVPQNGFISQGSFEEGTTVTFICLGGYEVVGASQATCTPDLTWSVPTPTCVRTCPALTPPANGALSPAQGPYFSGNQVTFSCNDGYHLVGLATISCTNTGDWASNNLPSCSEIVPTCPQPILLLNGNIVPLKTSYDVEEMITFQCLSAYQLVGQSSSVCQPDGSWSNPTPTCQTVSCFAPPVPIQGSLVPSQTTYAIGQQVNFVCNQGFEIVGQQSFAVCLNNGIWSYPTPECEEIICSAPLQPQNGGISPLLSSYEFEQQVSFSCNEGYYIVGRETVSCVSVNTWSGDPPLCQAIACMPPAQPQNGNISPALSSYAFQQQVTFACDSGYILVGEESLTCISENLWSGDSPSCQAITCTAPAQPLNGFISSVLSSYAFGQQVAFACNDGYHLVGEETATCTQQNTWSSPVPLCQVITCAAIAQPQNGNVSPSLSSYAYQQQVVFTCNIGYNLMGQESLRCIGANTWSGPNPTCQAITCSAPAQPLNGYIPSVLSSYAFQQEVTFLCNDGYQLLGQATATCVSPNTWSDPTPVCQELTTCDLPTVPIHGSIIPASPSYQVNEQVTFQCDTGYRLLGEQTATCLENGEWSILSPTCQVITCSPPTIPVNGQLSPVLSSYSIGQQVEFQCNNGYQLNGRNSVYCLHDGIWSSETPMCEEITCSIPIQPTNGRVTPFITRNPIGQELLFSCNSGYQISGSDRIVCRNDGTWSSQFPRCVESVPTSCITPPIPTNGYITPSLTSFLIGQQITFSCNPGFDLDGTATLECTSDASWSAIFPTCIEHVMCQTPLIPMNGAISPSSGPYDQGQQVVFSCNSGFQLRGVPAVVCQSDGSWTEPSPMCVQENCQPPESPANGHVIPPGQIPTGDKVTFICNTGYQLQGPSEAVCLPSLAWSVESPVCVVAMCSAPSPLDNGRVSPSKLSYNVNDEVTFTCNSGFGLVGSPTATCIVTSTITRWSSTTPNCIEEGIRCPALEPLRDGNISPSGLPSYPVGERVTFQCNSGYELQGATEIICTNDGTWSDNPPTCQLIEETCPPITLIINGNVDPAVGPHPVGQTVTFTCNSGYQLVGLTTIVCTLDGTWSSDSFPICREMEPTCESPSSTPNLIILPQQGPYAIGQVVTFACETGYDITGGTSAVCTNEMTWSVETPTCIKNVCTIQRPQNGKLEDYPEDVTEVPVGERITITCDEGYVLDGERQLTCTKERELSEDIPKCNKDDGASKNFLFGDEDLTIIIWAVIPSAVIILLVIIISCIICCRRKRRRERGLLDEQPIMAYRKQHRTMPSAQGTDIYNIYGERDNRPMMSNHNHNDNLELLESPYQRSLQRSHPSSQPGSHQSLPRSHMTSDHSLPQSHAESAQSLPRSVGLPAAESSGPNYANIDHEIDTLDRRRIKRNPMNQLTRV